MAKRAGEGGLLRRLRPRTSRAQPSRPPGPVEAEQSPPSQSWLPPAMTVDSDQERGLAEQRMRQLAHATWAGRDQVPSRVSDQAYPAGTWLSPGSTEEGHPETPVEQSPPAEHQPTDWQSNPAEQERSDGQEQPGPLERELTAEPDPSAWRLPAVEQEQSTERAEELPTGDREPSDSQLHHVEQHAPAATSPDEAPTRWLAPLESTAATAAVAETPPHEPVATTAEEVPVDPATLESDLSAAETQTFAPDRRQTLAVEAYCREACPPETATAAAAEVLSSFAGGDDDEMLRHTRATAAARANVTTRPGRLRRLLAGERESACWATPVLLAARANGDLDATQGRTLERHLDSCLVCQAAELRAGRAERAFAGIAGIELAVQQHPPEAAVEQAGAPAASERAPTEVSELAPTEAVPAVLEVPTVEATQTPAIQEPTPQVDAEPASGEDSWIAAGPVPVVTAGAAAAETAAAAPAAADELPPPAEPVKPSRSGRRGLIAVLAGGAALVVAAAVAVALLTSSGSNHPAAARVTTPVAPLTTPAATTPAPKARPRTPRKKPAAKPAAPAAAAAAQAAPPAAASSPAPSSGPSSSSSAPAASSPPASSGAPAPSSSAPAPAPSSSSSPPSSSGPPVSIQQPSLGSANAPQGVGK